MLVNVVVLESWKLLELFADYTYMMDHEKLDAYKVSIILVGETWNVLGKIRVGNSDIVNQLKRAILSIPLNIAEGVGKTTVADKKRFFSIARGSAMESAAIFDVLVSTSLLDKSDIDSLKTMCSRIIAMLTALCNKIHSSTTTFTITSR